MNARSLLCSLFLVFTSNINSIQSISNLSCVCISQKTWKNNLRVLSEVQAPVECVVSMLPGQWWCRTECNPNPCQYAALPDFPGLDYYIIQGYFAYCPSFSIQVISLHFHARPFEHVGSRDPRTARSGTVVDTEFSYYVVKF